MTRAPSIVALLGVLAAAVGGCGRVLGIHDLHARDGGAGAAGAVGTAGTGGGAAGTAGGAGTGTGTDAGAAGASADARPDIPSPADGPSPTDADASTDSPSDLSSDASDAAGPICPAHPPRTTTALLYNFGPNGSGGLGQCGFVTANLPADRSYGAVGPDLYENAAACGACLIVENLAGTQRYTVQIIDSTGTNDAISIDTTVHSKLSINGNNPMVRIHFAPCPYDHPTNIQVAFKEAGFAAPLLYNHRTRPTKVEIKGPGNTDWAPMTRQTFNYWFPPNGYSPGGSTVALRMTDEAGSVVTTGPLAITPELRDSGVQFPACTVGP